VSELGALLRKAREEKGFSLDDVQDQTKIRKRYLEALEKGDYDVLPGKFYIRAFIKNYAEFVGLDADELLKHYHVEMPEPEMTVSEVMPSRKPKRMRSARSERFGKILFSVLLWLFVFLIILVIWSYYMNKDGKPVNEADPTPITNNSDVTATPTPTSTEGQSTPTPTPTPTIGPVTITLMQSNGNEDTMSVSPAKSSYTVQVTNSGGASWLEIREQGKNGTKIYYDNIKDGETVSYTVSTDVYLNLGRPANLEVTLDGVVVEDGNNNKGSKRILLKMEGAGTTVE
jgi:cytoskeletal protein RodZ